MDAPTVDRQGTATECEGTAAATFDLALTRALAGPDVRVFTHPGPVPTDEERFARILAQLDRDEAAWLIKRLEPRHCKLNRRNAAIREAVEQHFRLPSPTASARQLAMALAAYRASNWPAEKDFSALPDSASPRHCALHRILRANDGKALAWQQIYNVCKD